MREVTVRIKFLKHALGHVKVSNGKFEMPRTVEGNVMFLPTWWQASLRTASKLLGRCHKPAGQILWDLSVDGVPSRDYYKRFTSKNRFALHEAFWPGQVVGVNCAVPLQINPEDLKTLLEYAGKYCGISPYLPRQYGFFSLVGVYDRLPQIGERD